MIADFLTVLALIGVYIGGATLLSVATVAAWMKVTQLIGVVRRGR